MVRAIRQQQPDAVFHLGDCERDTQRLEKEFPDLPLYRVCGNCDREPVNPEVLQLTLDGVKFFLTHGHRYSVKYTLDALLNVAYFAGADMVLVKDNFSALPKALVEGRRTVSGMRDILKIYLTRNLVLALLFIAIYIFVGYLPMLPIQNTYYAFVSVTIMAFFMTLFAKPDNNKELILPDVLRFCVPSAIMIAAFGLAVYGGFWWLQDQGMLNIDWAYMASIHGTDIEGLLDFYSWGIEVNTSEIVARSAMLFFITTAGILQMLLVSPRYRFLSPDGRTNKSLIPIILVVFVFLVIYAMYAYFPAIAVNLVELVIFPNEVFLLLIGITAVWFFAELFVLKKNVFKHAVDRFETLYMKKLQDAYTEGDVKEDD